MPLLLHEKNPIYGELFIWKITEEIVFFEGVLEAVGFDLDITKEWHPKRRKEWLTARFLIHHYSAEEVGSLTVDENGKPHFPSGMTCISISHSKDLVGILLHEKEVGIDIQVATETIHRTAKKHCASNDYEKLGPYYTNHQIERVVWSMKEAVYKAYGRGKLRYIEDIMLLEADVSSKGKILNLQVDKEGQIYKYSCRVRFLEPYCITQAIELID